MPPTYVLIDGRLVPIVSGGADEGDPGADAGMAGAESAAMDRIGAAIESGELTDGDPDPVVAAPTQAIAAPDAPVVVDDAPVVVDDADDEPMTVEGARKLRQEQKEYRERWGGLERMYEGLPEETRAFARAATPLALAGNPDLAAAVALVQAEYAGLHPDDKAAIDSVAARIADNPLAAAQAMMDIAAELSGDFEPDDDLDDLDLDDDDDPIEPEYLTAEQADARFQSFLQTAAQQRQDEEFAREEARHTDEILAEVKAMGYSLDSEDVREQARTESLFALARRLDGDLGKAHEALTGERLANVDEFVQERTADAARPLPPGAGAQPSERKQLETTDDAESAMNARLDAALGTRRQ